jgi:hypothetical protein
MDWFPLKGRLSLFRLSYMDATNKEYGYTFRFEKQDSKILALFEKLHILGVVTLKVSPKINVPATNRKGFDQRALVYYPPMEDRYNKVVACRAMEELVKVLNDENKLNKEMKDQKFYTRGKEDYYRIDGEAVNALPAQWDEKDCAKLGSVVMDGDAIEVVQKVYAHIYPHQWKNHMKTLAKFFELPFSKEVMDAFNLSLP